VDKNTARKEGGIKRRQEPVAFFDCRGKKETSDFLRALRPRGNLKARKGMRGRCIR